LSLTLVVRTEKRKLVESQVTVSNSAIAAILEAI
jgi:hypothetical protein